MSDDTGSCPELLLLFIALAEKVWDPVSSSQTLNLVRTAKKLVEDYPTVGGHSRHMQVKLQSPVNFWSERNRVRHEAVAVPVAHAILNVSKYCRFWL